MIGSGKVLCHGEWRVMDLRDIRKNERVLCPFCENGSKVLLVEETGKTYLSSERHSNPMCKRLSATKSIKYPRDCKGEELLEKLLSNHAKKSKTKILTLSDVITTGVCFLDPSDRIADGKVTDYLITTPKAMTLLKEPKSLGKRILRCTYEQCDQTSQSFVFKASWNKGKTVTKISDCKRIRLRYDKKEDFIAMKNALMHYELNDSGFSEEVWHTGDVLVAGDWEMESKLYCKMYCRSNCNGELSCHGMLTSKNTQLHQIIKI